MNLFMKYTKNQHVLSQWVLRNFRSDDTATAIRDKKRVWCHTVYLDPEIGNVVKDIPLPISSVAIKKNCFSLVDSTTGKKFDIENELSIYESRTAILFDKIVQEHDFEILLQVTGKNHSLETVLNFMVIQFILNLQNPQNKNPDKDEMLNNLIKNLVDQFEDLKYQINNPPQEHSHLMSEGIYEKIRKVVNSSSDKNEACKALFILFLIAESEHLPTLGNFLSNFRSYLFTGIYIEGIYHTGYDFESVEPRPVFTIGPNIMCIDKEKNIIDLPVSHNLSIHFSIGKRRYYNNKITIFSANPKKLKCKTKDSTNIYHVSHDYIDNITSIVNMNNLANSNTIYTPHCLKDVENYLSLQNENEEYFYSPIKPVLISKSQAHA